MEFAATGVAGVLGIPRRAPHLFDGLDRLDGVVAAAVDEPRRENVPRPADSGKTVDDNRLFGGDGLVEEGEDVLGQRFRVGEVMVGDGYVCDVLVAERLGVPASVGLGLFQLRTREQTEDALDPAILYELDPLVHRVVSLHSRVPPGTGRAVDVLFLGCSGGKPVGVDPVFISRCRHYCS